MNLSVRNVSAEVMEAFDRLVTERGYRSREEAIRELVRGVVYTGQFPTKEVSYHWGGGTTNNMTAQTE